MARTTLSLPPAAFLLILSLVLFGCDDAERDASGAIVEGGGLGVLELRVGDCFQDWEGALSGDLVGVSDLSAVPCNTPHDNEVFHLFDVQGNDFPGDAQLENLAEGGCFTPFEAYVGRGYASSRLAFGWVIPTESSWSDGDREIVCFLFDGQFERLAGSMRGSRE
jgi:hypothetical protein